MAPRVSVCMATFNGEKYLRPQLSSILAELGKTDEIVLSDDGSVDHTLDIAAGFNDSRIKICSNPGKRGIIHNFENALNRAGGDYIFLSDQDDVWVTGKVETMLSALKQYDLVVSDCAIVDDSGACVSPSYFALRRSGRGGLKNMAANSYMGACMGFNRKILDKALPFPRNIPMHDWWIGLVGELFGTTCFCTEKLVQYRRHHGNNSPFVSDKKYGLAAKAGFRINLALPLAGRWIERRIWNR